MRRAPAADIGSDRPLKVRGGNTVGTLKLYRSGRRRIARSISRWPRGSRLFFPPRSKMSELQRQSELLATAKLQALQSQIRPHFLFNALNTITSLIRTKPQRARELLVSLSELLRRSFKRTDKRIPLSDELYFIRSYLEIEKARFGDKLAVEWRY